MTNNDDNNSSSPVDNSPSGSTQSDDNKKNPLIVHIVIAVIAALAGAFLFFMIMKDSDDAVVEGTGDVTVESTEETSPPAQTNAQDAGDDPPSAWLIFTPDENGEYPVLIEGQDIHLDTSMSTIPDPENTTMVVTVSDGQTVEPDADGGIVLNFPEPGLYQATLTVTDSQGRSDESMLNLSVGSLSHYDDNLPVIR